MTRFAPVFLTTATLLFVAGVAGASTGLLVASVVVVIAMFAVLRGADEAATASPVLPPPSDSVTSNVRTVSSEQVVRVAPKAAAVKSRTKGTSPAKKATAVLDDVDAATLLGRVQGLGPARIKTIVTAFPTAAALRAATSGELTSIPGVGPAIADRIHAELG